MEKIKLDKIDKKLISYLFHNFREPITQIAKKCHISREQAEYRIRKYEEKEIIRKYYATFNLYSLGYSNTYILRLRVKNPSEEKLEKINQTKDTVIMTRMKCYGNWDYIITLVTKNRIEILDFISMLYDLWKEEILNYEVFEPLEIHFFPLKIFGISCEEKPLSFNYMKTFEIDDLDKKIINEISDNAKIKIIKISIKTKEKVETINYRLKRLEKNIITGYRIFLDLKKVGFSLAQIVLKMNNLSKEIKNKILSYGSKNKRIHACGIGIGQKNAVFQIIYEKPDELIYELNNLKSHFSEAIIEYELINIEKELFPQTINKRLTCQQ